VTGSFLLGLQHEADSSVGNRLANAIRLVTDDGEYIVRRNDFRSRSNYMRQ